MQGRGGLIWAGGCSVRRSRSDGRGPPRSLPGSAWAKLAHELIRRHEERILVEDAADDDHRMSSHDVDHRVSSKLRKRIHADDHIVVATPHIVHPRFELDEIVDVRSPFSRPIHVADDATE